MNQIPLSTQRDRNNHREVDMRLPTRGGPSTNLKINTSNRMGGAITGKTSQTVRHSHNGSNVNMQSARQNGLMMRPQQQQAATTQVNRSLVVTQGGGRRQNQRNGTNNQLLNQTIDVSSQARQNQRQNNQTRQSLTNTSQNYRTNGQQRRNRHNQPMRKKDSSISPYQMPGYETNQSSLRANSQSPPNRSPNDHTNNNNNTAIDYYNRNRNEENNAASGRGGGGQNEATTGAIMQHTMESLNISQDYEAINERGQQQFFQQRRNNAQNNRAIIQNCRSLDVSDQISSMNNMQQDGQNNRRNQYARASTRGAPQRQAPPTQIDMFDQVLPHAAQYVLVPLDRLQTTDRFEQQRPVTMNNNTSRQNRNDHGKRSFQNFYGSNLGQFKRFREDMAQFRTVNAAQMSFQMTQRQLNETNQNSERLSFREFLRGRIENQETTDKKKRDEIAKQRNQFMKRATTVAFKIPEKTQPVYKRPQLKRDPLNVSSVAKVKPLTLSSNRIQAQIQLQLQQRQQENLSMVSSQDKNSTNQTTNNLDATTGQIDRSTTVQHNQSIINSSIDNQQQSVQTAQPPPPRVQLQIEEIQPTQREQTQQQSSLNASLSQTQNQQNNNQIQLLSQQRPLQNQTALTVNINQFLEPGLNNRNDQLSCIESARQQETLTPSQASSSLMQKLPSSNASLQVSKKNSVKNSSAYENTSSNEERKQMGYDKIEIGNFAAKVEERKESQNDNTSDRSALNEIVGVLERNNIGGRDMSNMNLQSMVSNFLQSFNKQNDAQQEAPRPHQDSLSAFQNVDITRFNRDRSHTMSDSVTGTDQPQTSSKNSKYSQQSSNKQKRPSTIHHDVNFESSQSEKSRIIGLNFTRRTSEHCSSNKSTSNQNQQQQQQNLVQGTDGMLRRASRTLIVQSSKQELQEEVKQTNQTYQKHLTINYSKHNSKKRNNHQRLSQNTGFASQSNYINNNGEYQQNNQGDQHNNVQHLNTLNTIGEEKAYSKRTTSENEKNGKLDQDRVLDDDDENSNTEFNDSVSSSSNSSSSSSSKKQQSFPSSSQSKQHLQLNNNQEDCDFDFIQMLQEYSNQDDHHQTKKLKYIQVEDKSQDEQNTYYNLRKSFMRNHAKYLNKLNLSIKWDQVGNFRDLKEFGLRKPSGQKLSSQRWPDRQLMTTPKVQKRNSAQIDEKIQQKKWSTDYKGKSLMQSSSEVFIRLNPDHLILKMHRGFNKDQYTRIVNSNENLLKDLRNDMDFINQNHHKLVSNSESDDSSFESICTPYQRCIKKLSNKNVQFSQIAAVSNIIPKQQQRKQPKMKSSFFNISQSLNQNLKVTQLDQESIASNIELKSINSESVSVSGSGSNLNLDMGADDEELEDMELLEQFSTPKTINLTQNDSQIIAFEEDLGGIIRRSSMKKHKAVEPLTFHFLTMARIKQLELDFEFMAAAQDKLQGAKRPQQVEALGQALQKKLSLIGPLKRLSTVKASFNEDDFLFNQPILVKEEVIEFYNIYDNDLGKTSKIKSLKPTKNTLAVLKKYTEQNRERNHQDESGWSTINFSKYKELAPFLRELVDFVKYDLPFDPNIRVNQDETYAKIIKSLYKLMKIERKALENQEGSINKKMVCSTFPELQKFFKLAQSQQIILDFSVHCQIRTLRSNMASNPNYRQAIAQIFMSRGQGAQFKNYLDRIQSFLLKPKGKIASKLEKSVLKSTTSCSSARTQIRAVYSIKDLSFDLYQILLADTDNHLSNRLYKPYKNSEITRELIDQILQRVYCQKYQNNNIQSASFKISQKLSNKLPTSQLKDRRKSISQRLENVSQKSIKYNLPKDGLCKFYFSETSDDPQYKNDYSIGYYTNINKPAIWMVMHKEEDHHIHKSNRIQQSTSSSQVDHKDQPKRQYRRTSEQKKSFTTAQRVGLNDSHQFVCIMQTNAFEGEIKQKKQYKLNKSKTWIFEVFQLARLRKLDNTQHSYQRKLALNKKNSFNNKAKDRRQGLLTTNSLSCKKLERTKPPQMKSIQTKIQLDNQEKQQKKNVAFKDDFTDYDKDSSGQSTFVSQHSNILGALSLKQNAIKGNLKIVGALKKRSQQLPAIKQESDFSGSNKDSSISITPPKHATPVYTANKKMGLKEAAHHLQRRHTRYEVNNACKELVGQNMKKILLKYVSEAQDGQQHLSKNKKKKSNKLSDDDSSSVSVTNSVSSSNSSSIGSKQSSKKFDESEFQAYLESMIDDIVFEIDVEDDNDHLQNELGYDEKFENSESNSLNTPSQTESDEESLIQSYDSDYRTQGSTSKIEDAHEQVARRKSSISSQLLLQQQPIVKSFQFSKKGTIRNTQYHQDREGSITKRKLSKVQSRLEDIQEYQKLQRKHKIDKMKKERQQKFLTMATKAIKEQNEKKVACLVSTDYDKLAIKDDDGNTPLIIAVKTGNLAIVKMFIKNGANVNEQDSKGNTPLHIALQFNYMQIFDSLLNEGADEAIANNEGMFPWEMQTKTI